MQYIVTASELLTYRCTARHSRTASCRSAFRCTRVQRNCPARTRRHSSALTSKMKTILLMGGGMGHADHVKNIESLSQIGTPFQFLVVCGNNKKMLYHVGTVCRALSGGCKIYPHGFVHNVGTMSVRLHCIQAGRSYRVRGSGENSCRCCCSIRSPVTRSAMLIFWSTTAWRALIIKHFPIDGAVYRLFCNPVRWRPCGEPE